MKCNHLDCKKKVKLVEQISNKCKYCEKIFCYNHKIFIDHKCDKYKNMDNNIVLPNCNFNKIDKI